MKLTSSPSVSSTTTTKRSISGFLSFLLRRILCSTNLPTHPSDQLTETDKFEYQIDQTMKPHDDLATPGLVARLMGLDSMPDTIEHKNFPSITRSKSMSSVDCSVEEEKMQGHHRRMKNCVSLTETPSYFELEDDDFFVISFDNGGKNRKPRSRKPKAEMGGRENEQRRRRRDSNKGTRPRFKFEESNTDALVLEIENSDETKARNRRKKKDKCLEGAKVETESESENSSPVSVLDHSLFINDHQVPTSELAEKDSRSRNSCPRRKLASKVSTSDPSNESCTKGNDQNPSEATKGKRAGLRRKACRRQKSKEMQKQVWRFAKAEMLELEWKCEGGLMRSLKIWKAEIGVDLSLQIVDQLLDDVVDQLILKALDQEI